MNKQMQFQQLKKNVFNAREFATQSELALTLAQANDERECDSINVAIVNTTRVDEAS